MTESKLPTSLVNYVIKVGDYTYTSVIILDSHIV